MAAVPALWNQLRFNTDQPPVISNLISQPSAPRPGAILLGPDTQRQFVFANSGTLELAQQLARRDVAKMKERASPKPPSISGATRSRSPVASPPPSRPVQRLCKTSKTQQAAEVKQKRAEAAEEKRLKQQEQLRKRREAEEAELKRRRDAREKAATAIAMRNAGRTRVQQLQMRENPNELPARGDSPPVRDTDPQLVEIREQHQELMGMLRELIKMKPPSANKRQPGPSRVARAAAAPSSARPRGYLSETRASKSRQQSHPPRRRPCDNREVDEIEERIIQPMRLLNVMQATPSRQDTPQHPISARGRQDVLREHLVNRLGNAAPSEDDVGSVLAELLVDEVVGDTVKEVDRIESDSLPGNDQHEELLEPTVDELDFRLQQIESEYDAIRQRWRCLDYEDVLQDESPNVSNDAHLGPLVLENKAMLFTKRPEVHFDGHIGRLLPRPPQHVVVGLSRNSMRSITNGRDRYLDWMADRPGPRFSVDLSTVADWLCADLVDEILTQGVHDLDKASDDIVHLLLEGEMAGGEIEEGSTLADGENESSSFESESISPRDSVE